MVGSSLAERDSNTGQDISISNRVRKRGNGQFIGSISYITEEAAPVNIVSLEPTRYVSWPKTKLKDFMKKNPDLYTALQTTLAVDLTKWLEASWARQIS